MTDQLSGPAMTRVSRHIAAHPADIYEAFVDPEALASWLPPTGMTGVVHEFEPRAGGRIMMSLIYNDPAQGPGGKTTEDTDTFDGRFADLVPDERIVWAVEFASDIPGMSGEMRVIWDLQSANGGTNVTVTCENIPEGIRPEDNEAGSRSSLEHLAALFESRMEDATNL